MDYYIPYLLKDPFLYLQCVLQGVCNRKGMGL